jgi:hypothetical protein
MRFGAGAILATDGHDEVAVTFDHSAPAPVLSLLEAPGNT